MSLTNKIEDVAKRRGFFWPSQEIYGGVSGFYDYGPLGTLMKRHIEDIIFDHFIMEEKCLALESPILTSIDPWVASGHVDSFADTIVECIKCGESYRADHLIEEQTGKEEESITELQKIIDSDKIKCPKCSGNLGKVFDYNLMFKTFIGPGKNKIESVLRPETAQTTYMSFKRLFDIGRKKIPFGVVQKGKSFRNEISPRKAIIRMREFSQIEAQFFLDPSKKNEWKEPSDEQVSVLTKEDQEKGNKPKKVKLNKLKTLKPIAYFLGISIQLYEKMGIDKSKLVLRQHKDDEKAFYSTDTWDIEFVSDKYGKIELVGISDRTDYDLKRHQDLSKEKMEISHDGNKFVPHVIEVAYGIDRPLMCVLESCIKEEKDRLFFTFPAAVAPYQIGIFPLVRKEGLPEIAQEIYQKLKTQFYSLYDETGSIGKMYYRQDEAGTPYCITIDFDTKKDNTVTIRDRDTQKQIRIKIDELSNSIIKLISGEKIEKVGKLVK